MLLVRTLLVGILGPAVALIVTWQSAVTVINVTPGNAPTPEVVERLRRSPDDSVLRELREVAVSYPRYYRRASEEVLRTADEILDGKYVPAKLGKPIGVPFEPAGYLFGNSIWHLDLHSFSIPSLLGRAYEISGENKYLTSAVDYILDWAGYEASLHVQRGFFFNDHALAARSIVVTEIWRLYRDSRIYQAESAVALLRYVQRLSELLLIERLYEYRSNHGVMQSLSLLHLAIAFPALEVADENRRVGTDRLLSQFEYYVNDEGVILEHSPGYHLNGMGRLAAAARYLGILHEPVPDGFIDRYREALQFLAALRRPDLTVPPIGDTEDSPYSYVQVATFNDHSVVDPLHDEAANLAAPPTVTVAPGAGWIILWDGLAHWPETSKLTQTVFHWGNFPTAVHKHADELGLSLWSHGQQWIRSVGHWPYNSRRHEAIGWRSSNGPHWMGESSAGDRSSKLIGSVTDDSMTFFEVLRTNADGSRIRRQLVNLGDEFRIVLDSLRSSSPKTAEIVWRFPPDVTLEKSGQGDVTLNSNVTNRNLSMKTGGTGSVTVDVDATGSADWNSGMIVRRKLSASPAVRMTSSGENPVFLTAFAFTDPADERPVDDWIHWQWNDEANWRFSVDTGQGGKINVIRKANSMQIWRDGFDPRELGISTDMDASADASRMAALRALERARDRYGVPFQPELRRRAKVTLAITVTGLIQLALFFYVRARRKGLWLPLVIASCIAWIGLLPFLP
ncbi:MAG: heparinase II/III family protein [Woeseiaceae bacterium]